MGPTEADRTSTKVIESFAPTGGRVLGIVTLAIGVLILVDIALEWRTLQGLSAAAVVVAIGTLVWLGLIRPSVVAYEDALVLRNMIRDTRIPWHLVESASVAPVLAVAAGGQVYKSSAVTVSGADRRAQRRQRKAATEALRSGAPAPSRPANPADAAPSDYAVHRIESLAARYAEESRGQAQVEQRWRWVEFAVVAVAVLVAVVTNVLS